MTIYRWIWTFAMLLHMSCSNIIPVPAKGAEGLPLKKCPMRWLG
jgi:hypothetical protein